METPTCILTCRIFATPALAGWYIVHGPDRHCRVVVGPLRFGTREEAERDLTVVCRDNGYYREERGMREERRERMEHDRY